jgi:D-amino-acid dehydrogenase
MAARAQDGSDNGKGRGPRVVVVGAGVVGICAALHLQREGARVVVLDPQAPGEGASFGNMSIIGEDMVVPVATPGMLKQLPRMLMDPMSPLAIRWSYVPHLFPWLWRFLKAARPGEVERISRALAGLLDGAVEAFTPLLAEAGAADMLRRTGWLCVYESERGFRGYRGSLELQRRRGVRAEVLDAGELRQLEPALADSGRFHKGIYYPDVCYASDNYRLVRVLARAFRERGGRVLREAAADFDIGPEGPRGVVTEKGTHACEHVVIAAGAWSHRLTRKLGTEIPLETERGYHLTLTDPETRPRMPVFSTERATVCTPIDAGLRIGGTVELAGLDTPPDWRRADILLKTAQGWFPELTGANASRWMGHRPSLPDSMPVISRAPRFPNTVFAFGHGHCGLMLAARTGEMVRDLVLDREPAVDPTPFQADRF